MTLKERNGHSPWVTWASEHKDADAARCLASALAPEMDFWKWVQFEFYTQWEALHQYATQNGISIIGDMPIYAAHDSVDVWRAREQFLLQDDGNQSLLHLMQDALWHFEAAAPDAGALLSAYGQLLVQHVSLRRPSAPQSQVVEDLARSIAQNFANPLYELDEQLRSAPYCYDYLCRLFRQEMNTTPHKYLANLRLETAADMLRQGAGRSITEIARMCGYSDPLYFSRMFKKRYGISPREYGKAAEE
jgi:AraC-like DNA-binding protein